MSIGSTEPRRPAVFLDRDGVLNVDTGYVSTPAAFRWIEGAREAVALLNRLGYLTVVVTNQSGIARGFYGEAELQRLHAWMAEDVARLGGHFDAIYFCPHLPDADVPQYRIECACRKPRPGMILAAMRDHSIDPERSFLIGDKARDCDAARAAGIPGFLFAGDNLLLFVEELVARLTE